MMYSTADLRHSQYTLLTIAICIFAVLCNVYGAKRLPSFEGVVLVFHIIG